MGGGPPGAGSASRPRGSGREPCTHNCIQSVWILNPYPETGEVQQFVNLGQDAAYAGHSDEQGERRGHMVKVRIILDQSIEEAGQGSFTFQARLVPGDSNARYTNTEKGRGHGHYRARPENQAWSVTETITSGNDTVLDGFFFVTAAGGDAFTIQARCPLGHVVSSRPIRVWRRLWLQEVKMRNVPAANNLTVFRNKFQNDHYLAMRQQREILMEHMPNIGDGTLEKQEFLRNTRRAYDRVRSGFTARERHVVVIAYTDHLAVKRSNFEIGKGNVLVHGTGGHDEMEQWVDVPLVDGGSPQYLWKGLDAADTDEERFRSWFVSAHLVTPSRRFEIPNPQANCRPVADPAGGRPDACNTVRVNVARIIENDAMSRIELVVHIVDRMRGGISFQGGNLICVCTRAWWRDKSVMGQNAVLIHEMGHKIGMVPDGSNCDLEAGAARFPDEYTNRGHRGSHCCFDIGPPNPGPDYTGNENPGCVMFGASDENTRDFCARCGGAVSKVDLSDGWDLFSPALWTVLQFV